MVLIRMSNSMMKKVKLSDSRRMSNTVTKKVEVITASTLQTLSLIPGLLGFKIPSLENKNLLDGDINNWNLHGCYNSSEFGYNTIYSGYPESERTLKPLEETKLTRLTPGVPLVANLDDLEEPEVQIPPPIDSDEEEAIRVIVDNNIIDVLSLKLLQVKSKKLSLSFIPQLLATQINKLARGNVYFGDEES
ncbi:unnamed protein product [Vicia faba]|uniref:Uncharacterized protein n=1 Tax=Vicia faba TaxID=3906 RepID=A0AAV0ZCM4_VICFA|nr:unnamed protein product [Vicia faba]